MVDMEGFKATEKLRDTNKSMLEEKVEEFVTFDLEGEHYGVDVLRVQEIIGYTSFTKVPNMPAFVKGVINLRGSILPVVDLRSKFNMNERDCDQFAVILVLEVGEKIIGAIVDAVSDVISLSKHEIEPTPDFAAHIKADFIYGMGRKDDGLIILLDVDKMLDQQEMTLLDAA